MLYFIVNELSGKGMGKNVAEKIKQKLKSAGVEFFMAVTQYRAHATLLAENFSKKDDCNGIIAVGGDGTFSEVLNGLDLKIPMGVISAGSGNDFLRTFAPDSTCDTQIDAVLGGKTKNIDYIDVNGKRSLNVAGTGFDVDILLKEKKFHKFLGGSASYFAALIATLFTLKFRKFEISLGGGEKQTKDCLLLAVANGKYFGGGLPLSLSSDLSDGLLDVTLVKRMPFFRIPGMLIKFLKGRISEVKDYVEIYRCTQIECFVTPKTDIQLDGELFDFSKFTCVLKKGELKMFTL